MNEKKKNKREIREWWEKEKKKNKRKGKRKKREKRKREGREEGRMGEEFVNYSLLCLFFCYASDIIKNILPIVLF